MESQYIYGCGDYAISPKRKSTDLMCTTPIKLPIVDKQNERKKKSKFTVTTNITKIPSAAGRRFRTRKSISMLEIKRTKDKQQVMYLCKDQNNDDNVPKIRSNILDTCDKTAGYKVFVYMLLHGWRKKRMDNRKLYEDLRHCKKNFLKAKNQIHVINSILKMEIKKNEENSNEISGLKHFLQESENRCKERETESQMLLNEIDLKKKEWDTLYMSFRNLKIELTKTIDLNRKQELKIEIEKGKLIDCQKENEILIEKIEKLKDKLGLVGMHEIELELFRQNVQQLEQIILQTKIQEAEKLKYKSIENDINLKVIEQLTLEIEKIRHAYQMTVNYKAFQLAKFLWNEKLWYCQKILNCMIPNFPTPSIIVPTALPLWVKKRKSQYNLNNWKFTCVLSTFLLPLCLL